MDAQTGATEKVETDPLGKVDLSGVTISDVSHEVIATSYNDDRVRIYWKDKDFEKDYDLIKKKLGDREISFNSSTADETRFIVSTYSDTDPGTVWLFDRKSRDLSTLYQVRENLDRKALSPIGGTSASPNIRHSPRRRSRASAPTSRCCASRASVWP